MKLYAYTEQSRRSRIVHILEVRKWKHAAKIAKLPDYYSIGNLEPLTAATERVPPIFCYKKNGGGGNGSGGGGEGLAHELAKEVIVDSSKMTFKFPEGIREFHFTKVEPEYIHRTENDFYRVDLLCHFEGMPEYTNWDGKIALEICDRNPITEKKVAALKSMRCAIFELKLDDYYHVENDEFVSEKRIDALRDALARELSKPQVVTFHFTPDEEHRRSAARARKATMSRPQQIQPTAAHTPSADASRLVIKSDSNLNALETAPKNGSIPQGVSSTREQKRPEPTPSPTKSLVAKAPPGSKIEPASRPSTLACIDADANPIQEPSKPGFFSRLLNWWNNR